MENDMKELTDLELENISGGHTCHSKGTYESLGIADGLGPGQSPSYHPVITTAMNSCRFHTKGDPDMWACSACDYHKCKGPTIYCKARSRECDGTK